MWVQIPLAAPVLNCQFCKKEFAPFRSQKNRKYCSSQCQKEERKEQWVKGWKAGTIQGWTGVSKMARKPLRRYFIEKYGEKCMKCGWNKQHPITNKVPLELNHIDGNASNCVEENLELICPCCHSLTVNFKSLNKQCTRFR